MAQGPTRQSGGRHVSRRAAARLWWLGPSDLVARLPIDALTRALPGLPPEGGVEPVSLRALESRLAGSVPPDAILSPLFWQDGDVMETARLLWSLDYAGPYRIVSPPLPRPGMVLDEVLTMFPGLDIALIELRRPSEERPEDGAGQDGARDDTSGG